MKNAICIAKIESSHKEISRSKVEYSVLYERGCSVNGWRLPVEKVVYVPLEGNIEDEIRRKHRFDCVQIVDAEEFEEYVSLFHQEDEERIAKQVQENEERDEKEFYNSLQGIRLRIHQDLNLQGMPWRKAASAIDDEFRRRYSSPVEWGVTDGINGLQGR